MKTSIATVCLSGTLTQKLEAAALAGFDGVELFDPDLTAAPESPEEIRALADRLGITLDLFQPMRDVEGVTEAENADVLRRAEAKFTVMRRLGMDLVLMCSNVGTATIDNDEVSAGQLRRLGDLAASYGVRIAYEALAWGKYVDDYRRAWRIVQLADHPAVGVCLDSFHILSRGHDPAEIAEIPGERIFFLQLSDAPALSMDVLSWSRHHRLFPGEGTFALVDFVATILRAGYRGPLSLEVFNDTFRQTDPVRTARHALRSLRALEDAVVLLDDPALDLVDADVRSLPPISEPTAVDFIEVKAEDTSPVEVLLSQAGFTARGRHRTKPVTLWSSGDARVVLNEQHARGEEPHLSALGFAVAEPDAMIARAGELGEDRAYRRTYASEQPIDAVIAPDGTEVYWAKSIPDSEPTWVGEFEHGAAPVVTEGAVTGVDHVSLTLPWSVLDETVLFFTSMFALESAGIVDVAGPSGLVQSRVMQSADSAIRIPLNVAPPSLAESIADADAALPQHVAFTCADVLSLAAGARERGLPVLKLPANYYDDLAARFALPEEFVDRLRDLNVAYDRDGSGEYLHFYTATIGRVFWEFVERREGYGGFGAASAPVRLVTQGSARGAGLQRGQ